MIERLTQTIVSRFIRDHEHTDDLKVRARYGQLEGWASIVTNTVLFAVKLVIGIQARSVALIADAAHTFADSATSVVIIIGFRVASTPSDREHPFGHGRMEAVASLVVSVLLFVGGVELLKHSVIQTMKPTVTSVSNAAVAIVSVTIVIKELLARFAFTLGRMIDSRALEADALHHRSDVLATALVVAALLASRAGLTWVDGAGGIVVSLMILWCAYAVARDAIGPLLGEAPTPELLRDIRSAALGIDGVQGVHDIIVHNYGGTRLVSLHAEVSAERSAAELHELAELVEGELEGKLGAHPVVHIDPICTAHPDYQRMWDVLQKIMDDDGRVHAFHDLRIIGRSDGQAKVVFDIVLDNDTDRQETHDVIHAFDEQVRQHFPGMKTIIRAEPRYTYTV
ncbi:MAG: cation transporter [Lentisphaerae bacterium]|jgi:cation diffusion facilitator family transporter|nr:cation transporter [Lentisphaerota bacterium]MBT4814497.1 cation transporter [Lentisphaerota bacterium]MBT5605218.1 cation transporter [Lentisphaerota bacterium]MBT7054330.1 cation transporter [Lentisphaerota bacterium]MBT7844886.1 cation transporter [Lentisphaerota bacterium]